MISTNRGEDKINYVDFTSVSHSNSLALSLSLTHTHTFFLSLFFFFLSFSLSLSLSLSRTKCSSHKMKAAIAFPIEAILILSGLSVGPECMVLELMEGTCLSRWLEHWHHHELMYCCCARKGVDHSNVLRESVERLKNLRRFAARN